MCVFYYLRKIISDQRVYHLKHKHPLLGFLKAQWVGVGPLQLLLFHQLLTGLLLTINLLCPTMIWHLSSILPFLYNVNQRVWLKHIYIFAVGLAEVISYFSSKTSQFVLLSSLWQICLLKIRNYLSGVGSAEVTGYFSSMTSPFFSLSWLWFSM